MKLPEIPPSEVRRNNERRAASLERLRVASAGQDCWTTVRGNCATYLDGPGGSHAAADYQSWKLKGWIAGVGCTKDGSLMRQVWALTTAGEEVLGR